ncbi:MAG: hypothetical protein A2Y81_06970 [Nitrospirae bacterium RBG_13_43_8]|nr:MAG: hypothetical protein A2Y81_06970 [Nitrospirae bacterium RBG_13_43_8]
MTEQRAKSKEQRANPPVPPLLKGGEGGLFSKGGHGGINEKGIALVMILVMSAIALAIMAGLIYMITAGTQISGMQKRYETAREAAKGGADVTYQLIDARGNPGIPGINLYIITPGTCVTLNTTACTAIGSYTGIATKLNLPTSCWSGCDSSMSIIPPPLSSPDNTTYDMRFDIGASPYPIYRIYGKIVDTIEGNSGLDEGLGGKGVVSTGEVTVVSKPYLYTIELNAENKDNPSERAKYSILYQY